MYKNEVWFFRWEYVSIKTFTSILKSNTTNKNKFNIYWSINPIEINRNIFFFLLLQNFTHTKKERKNIVSPEDKDYMWN